MKKYFLIFANIVLVLTKMNFIVADPVIIAFDIETSGPHFDKNALLSIGVSVQNLNGVEIDSFQKNMTLPEGRVFDEKCYNEFWVKNPEAYKFVTSETSQPKEVMRDFVLFLANIERIYPDNFIVSNNSSFDVAWINLYLALYTDRLPLNYRMNGTYRMIWDSASVQKAWCGLRTGCNFTNLPRKHREVLHLASPFTHDHNPLNDAREIASFFIQTWQQMGTEGRCLLKEEKKMVATRPLIIVPHNPEWAVFFEQEAQKIKACMRDVCLDVIHVGSTSVEGLSAKPIIDIILVTNNLQQAGKLLTEKLGYRYKGEYNLPLRDLYGKKDKWEIYLHVHLAWNEEIRLNVSFRNYLRSHLDAKKAYEAIKIQASQAQGATEKTSTGITQYNLLKNDQIVSILKATGFDGLCVRFATQQAEHQAFDLYKKEFYGGSSEEKQLPADVKKFVIYKGTVIEGAAELLAIGEDRYLLNFLNTSSKECSKQLLQVILLWLKERFTSGIVLATLSEPQAELYLEAGFTLLEKTSKTYKAIKSF